MTELVLKERAVPGLVVSLTCEDPRGGVPWVVDGRLAGRSINTKEGIIGL